MASIQVLVGSVMGTAETVAEAVAAELRQLQHTVTVNFQADVSDILRDENEILLVCTSNTGSGDLIVGLDRDRLDEGADRLFAVSFAGDDYGLAGLLRRLRRRGRRGEGGKRDEGGKRASHEPEHSRSAGPAEWRGLAVSRRCH